MHEILQAYALIDWTYIETHNYLEACKHAFILNGKYKLILSLITPIHCL